MLKHFTCYLDAYALQYYFKLELIKNKYYLKHTTTVNHKPTFVMAKKDPIPNTIFKKVKENFMETQQWAQRLEDSSESYAFKDVLNKQ